jgi:hypothetical protein
LGSDALVDWLAAGGFYDRVGSYIHVFPSPLWKEGLVGIDRISIYFVLGRDVASGAILCNDFVMARIG